LEERERVDIIHAKEKQSQAGIHQEDQDDEIEPGNEGNDDEPGDKPEAT
jgi:hypothetical protein